MTEPTALFKTDNGFLMGICPTCGRKERDRDRERQRQKQTHRQTDRQTDRDRDRDPKDHWSELSF